LNPGRRASAPGGGGQNRSRRGPRPPGRPQGPGGHDPSHHHDSHGYGHGTSRLTVVKVRVGPSVTVTQAGHESVRRHWQVRVGLAGGLAGDRATRMPLRRDSGSDHGCKMPATAAARVTGTAQVPFAPNSRPAAPGSPAAAARRLPARASTTGRTRIETCRKWYKTLSSSPFLSV
jgi:hypothetical protein